MDVHRRQLGRAGERRVAVAHAVKALVAVAQAAQDQHRIGHRRLGHHDLLEAPRQRVVLLEVAAVLLVGGGADAAQLAAAEHRLEDVGGVHCTAGGGAGAHDGVDFVDEQDGAGLFAQGADHPLEPLLEVAAELGAGEQRAEVEADDAGVAERRRHLAVRDAQRDPFHDGGLADAGVADQHGAVLLAPAEDLQGAFGFPAASDQGVDGAGGGAFGEIGGVALQEPGRGVALGRGAWGCAGFGAGRLRSAVRDDLQHVDTRNALFLQEEGGVRVGLQQEPGQHVAGAGLLALGAAHLQHHALQHAAHGAGHVQFVGGLTRHRLQVVAKERLQPRAQLVAFAAAGGDDRRAVVVVQQRVQQVFQGHELVTANLGLPKRRRNRQFNVAAEHYGAS